MRSEFPASSGVLFSKINVLEHLPSQQKNDSLLIGPTCSLADFNRVYWAIKCLIAQKKLFSLCKNSVNQRSKRDLYTNSILVYSNITEANLINSIHKILKLQHKILVKTIVQEKLRLYLLSCWKLLRENFRQQYIKIKRLEDKNSMRRRDVTRYS